MRFSCFLIFCGLLALNGPRCCRAGTIAPPPPPKTARPNPNGGLLGALLKRGKEGKPLQVDRRKTAICPVCGHPYYEHADPGFHCVPRDRDVQQVKWVKVRSPINHRVFWAAKKGHVNGLAGTDRDLCRHSVGKASVQASVWMCPETGYAAPYAWFGKELDGQPLRPETIRLVREKLTPKTRQFMMGMVGLTPKPGKPIPANLLQFSDYVKQTGIPDWFKYENALFLLEHGPIKPPHALLAKYHLEAAHANRRFICSQLDAPGLDPRLEISLGQHIRRMSNYLLAECLQIRKERKETVLDPLKTPTDPALLTQAAASIIKKGEQVVHAQERQHDPRTPQRDQARFQVGDIYVLRLRQAGYLDRLGDIPAALKTLRAARKILPSGEREGVKEQLRKLLVRQMDLLRKVVDERIEALRREREHLYRAADELMQALYFNEEPKKYNPAVNSYLVGELLRRDGREPQSALAWFQAAKTLLRKDPRKGSERKELLLKWTEEGVREISKRAKDRKLNKHVERAIARVLGRSGVATTAGSGPQRTVQIPTHGSGPAAPNPHAPRAPRTRELQLKLYFAALSKYHAKHKATPSSLQDLVAEGFLDAQAASLNVKGKPICPQSGRKLIYSKRARLGDPTTVLIFPYPKDPDQRRLFGDGHVGVK